VVQKALSVFADERKKFILDESLQEFIKLANDANGLCLIKKVIPTCCKFPEFYTRMVEIITKNSIDLVQNPYGNYAIQVALDNFDISKLGVLIDSLKGKYAQLSMLKFSSNVVEKFLEKGDLDRQNMILSELLSSEKLLALMKNNFGNYVVQKALNLAKGDMKVELATKIQENIGYLADKKLKTKWSQILDKAMI